MPVGSPKTVDLIQELRDNDALIPLLPTDPQAVIVTAFDASTSNGNQFGGGGIFRWDPFYPGASVNNDNGGTVIKPDSMSNTASGRWVRIADGPLNVKWFGARGDDGTDDTAAIQQAIDLASYILARSAGDRLNSYIDGGCVYLPKGRYVVNGGLTLPRFSSYRTLTIRGDGRDATILIRVSGASGAGLFEPQASLTPPADAVPTYPGATQQGTNNTPEIYPNFANSGRIRIQDFSMSVGPDLRCVNWTSTYGGRPAIHFVNLHFRGANSTSYDRGPVYLWKSDRVLFEDCEFSNIGSGVGVEFDGGAANMINCRGASTVGALVKGTNGFGEALFLGCRAEGGIARPSWEFVGGVNITIVNAANEGWSEKLDTDTYPALFRFRNCKQVVLVQPQLALQRVFDGSGNPADGIVFDGCTGCEVNGGLIGGSFRGNGTGTARAVRILANCRYVRVRGIHSNNPYLAEAPVDDYGPDFENLGIDCSVEMLHYGTTGGVAVGGTQHAHTLHVWDHVYLRRNYNDGLWGAGGKLHCDNNGQLVYVNPDGNSFYVNLTPV